MPRLADTVVAGAGERAGRPADPMLPRPFRLVGRRQDTADTATLVLEPVDGHPLRFVPGQFTMLGVPGAGEVPISISGAAGDDLLVHTVRDVGGVTRALVGAPVGRVLAVRGPYGTGWDVADGAGGDVVFVAGGIGLAPLRPAMLEVLAHRERYGHVALLYGARTPEDMLYRDELDDWRRHGVVEVTVDQGSASWRGRVGLVTALLPLARFHPARTLALVCGPEVMMRFVAARLTDAGVPAGRVRVSLERNMKCGVGLCGHCQLRELFVCVDGPVFDYPRVRGLLTMREV